MEKGQDKGADQTGRRIPFRARVVMIRKDTGERTIAEARDLAMGGMFVKTLLPFKPGTLLDVEVPMKPINYLGSVRVLWNRTTSEGEDRPYGMAVVWVDPTPNQKRLLFLQIDDYVRGGGELIQGSLEGDMRGPPRVSSAAAAPGAVANPNRKLLIIGLAIAAVVALVLLVVVL